MSGGRWRDLVWEEWRPSKVEPESVERIVAERKLGARHGRRALALPTRKHATVRQRRFAGGNER